MKTAQPQGARGPVRSPEHRRRLASRLRAFRRECREAARRDAELRHSRKLLAEAERLSHTGAWEWDVAADRWTFSDEWRALHGCGAAALPGSELLALVHPEDRARIAAAFDRLRRGRETYDLEHRILRQDDGRERIVHARGRYVTDPAGRVVRVYGFVQDVTERRRAEEALRDREERLRAIFDHAGVGIVEVEGDDRLVKVNERACQVLGRTEAELLAMDVHGLTAPEDRAASAEVNGRIHRGEADRISYEKRYLRGDGSPVWVHATVSAVRDAAGRWVRSITTLEDISERKRAEQALRRRAEEVEQILDIVPAAVFVAHDPECRTITANRRGNALYEALEGENVSATSVQTRRYFTSEGRELHAPELPMQVAARTNREVGETELHATLPSGRRLAILGGAVPLRDEDGRVRGCLGAFLDITARQAWQEELARSEARYRELVQNAASAIVRWRRDGTILYFNEYAQNFFGYAEEEVVGRSVGILVPDRESTGTDLGGLVRDIVEHPDRYASSVNENVLRDGRRVWMAWTNHPVRDASGEVTEILAVGTDITARVLAQQALERTVEELARSNRDLEQFAYVSSHDLQEPLRMVSNFVQLLKARYDDRLDDDARTYIQFASEGAARMRNLVDDLLAYSRTHRAALRAAPVEASSAVTAALDNLQVALREAGGQVTVGELPVVHADAGQLTQLFQNLLGNAIKFRKPGQAPRVHVSVARDGRAWVFSVRDEGIGIDRRHHEKVFTIFQRLHGRERYPGTGIGLAVCRTIVERHGGRIWVESRAGEGADFRFTLPPPAGGAAA